MLELHKLPEVVRVCCSDPAQLTAAKAFANLHRLSWAEPDNAGLLMDFTGAGICLRAGKSMVLVDFIAGELAHRSRFGGDRKQTLARAIGIKSGQPLPTVVDATAGLGKDAFVLASLGCEVRMLECSPVVVALVKDAFVRAQSEPDFQALVANGFSLQQGNSIELLAAIASNNPPDTVYLDPMYPGRTKTAAVKKNMQLLQRLLGNSAKSNGLLDAALGCALKRVVVKRPKGAPFLDAAKPSMNIASVKTRYDIYLKGV